MAADIVVPHLGEGMVAATLVEWRALDGEWVEKGSVVLVVETHKTTWDVEAEASGYLHILVQEQTEAPVLSVVGLIAETEEELEALRNERPSEILAEDAEFEGVSPETSPVSRRVKAKEVERIRISPIARKIAEEHKIDIASITGTGPRGRIVREDIEIAIEAEREKTVPAPSAGKTALSTIPVKGMRKEIAEHMHRSLSTSAQVTIMGEIDMAEAMKLRDALLAQAEATGTRVTYTDLLVFVLARRLRQNPLMNSSMTGDEIKHWEEVNIGIAVALDDGLIVPVIKNADKKSLMEISKARTVLVKKAREGKLTFAEVTGGTFTITNLGAVVKGYFFSTPIINQPESAIFGMGAITDRVVARDGQAVIRPIMTYSLTHDHRVIDGAVAAEFMAGVIGLLETPYLLMAQCTSSKS